MLGLIDLAGAVLSECGRGKNTRQLLTGLFCQSVFGRLAYYEDVNEADRLAHGSAMRTVVDRDGLDRRVAVTSQMGRFETEWLTSEANLAALTDLSGAWIDRVHACKLQTTIVLDMDNSVSETDGRTGRHANCTLAPPPEIAPWSMTTLRERLVKIGAKIVRHGRSGIFQMAEVMVARDLFQQILTAIAALRQLRPARR